MPPVGTTGRPRIVFGRGVELRADGHWGWAGHSGWFGCWETLLAAAGRPPSAGAWAGILTGHFILLQLLAAVMTAYGLYVCYLMLRRPEDLAVEENHVSWAHMYRMMFVAQIGFALAYLL